MNERNHPMITKLNFKSVVVIGAFNPSILTPNFLTDYCGFKPSHGPQGRTTPVASEIIFGNIRFVMELSKFQIVEKEIDKLDSLFPLDVVSKYLKVLEYTPLNVCGVNFNYTISEIQISSLNDKFHDIWQLGEKLGWEPVSVNYSIKKPDGTGLRLVEFDVSRLMNEIRNTIKVTIENESVLINNNFEVGQLETDRNRIELLTTRYEELVDQNNSLVAKIFE